MSLHWTPPRRSLGFQCKTQTYWTPGRRLKVSKFGCLMALNKSSGALFLYFWEVCPFKINPPERQAVYSHGWGSINPNSATALGRLEELRAPEPQGVCHGTGSRMTRIAAPSHCPAHVRGTERMRQQQTNRQASRPTDRHIPGHFWHCPFSGDSSSWMQDFQDKEFLGKKKTICLCLGGGGRNLTFMSLLGWRVCINLSKLALIRPANTA